MLEKRETTRQNDRLRYDDIVIDQTLYWKVTAKDEAWFQVAVLNSIAMTEAVRPFNPKGDFGERHIHTLPYRLMPAFDSGDEVHVHLAELGRELARLSREIIASDENVGNPAKPLSSRRSRLRKTLLTLRPFLTLEEHCAALLGTTPFGDE